MKEKDVKNYFSKDTVRENGNVWLIDLRYVMWIKREREEGRQMFSAYVLRERNCQIYFLVTLALPSLVLLCAPAVTSLDGLLVHKCFQAGFQVALIFKCLSELTKHTDFSFLIFVS